MTSRDVGQKGHRQDKRLVDHLKKALGVQRAIGASTRKNKTNGLQETAKSMKLKCLKPAVTDAEKKVYDNMVPVETLKSNKRTFFESKEGS